MYIYPKKKNKKILSPTYVYYIYLFMSYYIYDKSIESCLQQFKYIYYNNINIYYYNNINIYIIYYYSNINLIDCVFLFDTSMSDVIE
jgi:hypothetical protein